MTALDCVVYCLADGGAAVETVDPPERQDRAIARPFDDACGDTRRISSGRLTETAPERLVVEIHLGVTGAVR